jgi:hypothetical protein
VVSQLVRSPGVYYTGAEGPCDWPDPVRRQGHSEPWRLARVRDQQQGPAQRQGRPQAEDPGHDPAARGGRRGQRRDAQDVRPGRRPPRAPVHPADARQGHAATQDEALIEVYKKLRPGDPPTVDNARALVTSLFFNFRRYDLGRVGRYKLNKALGEVAAKLKIDLPSEASENLRDARVISRNDIIAIIGKLIELNNGRGEPDDIDHLGNRRIRANGELIQNQFRIGLLRMERVVKERMTITDSDQATPNTLINIRPS